MTNFLFRRIVLLLSLPHKVEIDEYRDYEKALGALNEAVKQLTKAGPTGEKLAQLNKRVFLVERLALLYLGVSYTCTLPPRRER